MIKLILFFYTVYSNTSVVLPIILIYYAFISEKELKSTVFYSLDIFAIRILSPVEHTHNTAALPRFERLLL